MNRKLPRMISLITVCLFVLFLAACSDNDDAVSTGETGSRAPDDEMQTSLPENDDKVTTAQGVWGNVWFWEGDHMPSADEDSPSGTITPVQREVYIYETTTGSDVTETQDPCFYSEINTALVATASSDADGFYQLSLLPGSYSVFVKENDLYYANVFNGNGEIGVITVAENQVQKYQIDITYQATF